MGITGYISIGLPLGPNTETDPVFITDPQYGLGGLRTVGTTAERDAIVVARRQIGMMVYVQSDDNYYSLIGGTSNANWVEFSIGVGTPGVTGATGPQLTMIDTVSTSIDPIVLKGASAHSLSGDSFLLTYAGGLSPLTGCAFLTNPSKGTGFPVYFSTPSMTGIDFTTQTITAGIGESVTIRIVLTGPDSYSSDSYDYEVTFGNELRWGATNGASLTGTQIQTILTNAVVKETPNHDFSLNMNYGDYLYFSYPARLGNTVHSINNAGYGGMSLQGTWVVEGSSPVLTTNSNGFTEAFYVYRSNQGLGELLRVKTEAI